MSQGATRREVLLQALTGYALVRTLLWQDALAGPVRQEVQAWLSKTHELCAELREKKLTPREWQQQLEALYTRVPLPELLAAIDVERLKPGLELPDDRAGAVLAPLPRVEGLPRVFGSKLFGLAQGRAVVPHGHQNMVSMHVVLAGEFHLRHFERVESQPRHLVLRPSIDRVSGPGDLSSISDQHDNVHWLVATKGPAYTFDLILDRLDPALGFAWKLDYVDVARAEPLAGGLLRARRIEFDEAVRRYGKT
ncbi:hypothetical protein LXT21_35910 [Myxococcus sp. K38C18041901]|uniref:hypothetical protein n=1 Tax=Myxococcus guangdongensis TaxID=2906760 RepID=UPI0020A783CB|nr:hypothetical protein [Myxococcus guangdongensis]MCP3064172.1 hypothetical protein [Myxococcus guangdongensis]